MFSFLVFKDRKLTLWLLCAAWILKHQFTEPFLYILLPTVIFTHHLLVPLNLSYSFQDHEDTYNRLLTKVIRRGGERFSVEGREEGAVGCGRAQGSPR